MLTHLPRGFYEGKPFQIMASDEPDDGTKIKHYRDITVSSVLFNIVKGLKTQDGVAQFVVPDFVQITQKDRHDE